MAWLVFAELFHDDVAYSQSLDVGATWTPPVRVNPRTTASILVPYSVDVVGMHDGHAVVLWRDLEKTDQPMVDDTRRADRHP